MNTKYICSSLIIVLGLSLASCGGGTGAVVDKLIKFHKLKYQSTTQDLSKKMAFDTTVDKTFDDKTKAELVGKFEKLCSADEIKKIDSQMTCAIEAVETLIKDGKRYSETFLVAKCPDVGDASKAVSADCQKAGKAFEEKIEPLLR